MNCRHCCNDILGWMVNNKIIVFLSLLSFSLMISTWVLSDQKHSLNQELKELKESMTSTTTSTTSAPVSVETTSVSSTVSEQPSSSPSSSSSSAAYQNQPEDMDIISKNIQDSKLFSSILAAA